MRERLRKRKSWNKLHKAEKSWSNLQEVFFLFESAPLWLLLLGSSSVWLICSLFALFLGGMCTYVGLEKESQVWLLQLQSRLLISDTGIATLNIFVGVGGKHYLSSAWFAASKALDTVKNSV